MENQFQNNEAPTAGKPSFQETSQQNAGFGGGQARLRQGFGGQAGPIVGSIVVITVLVLGGLYFIGKKVNEGGLLEPSAAEIQNAPDELLHTLKTQGTSDEVNAIEEDLNATELENLDAELQDIEAELNF